ncbi:MAG: hypothetical protein IPH61_13140 [Bacteroidetes bacterium]|nr:hypothetical protein [Bacteroidota bacterium]MBP8754364.1 hypothetical protein [Chitinophagales bacterium]MBP9190241.1 hypothetical protein [Chitinophagales bacterium]MBP9703713.1 hypothetical protein [Chitinophagales bacterium]
MRSFSTVLLVCVFLQLGAQEDNGQLLQITHHRVMVIPFNEFYYLSDADPELAKANNKNPEDVSVLFRYGITNNVATRVISSYDTYNILTDTTVQSQVDLNRIYGSILYKYQKPINSTDSDSSSREIFKQDVFGLKHEVEQPKASKKNSTDPDKKFMNAVVKDETLFPYLQEKYGVDMFVFINQFEVKTNWENCLDLATHNFEREIIVHFSIYNAMGKELKGDAVSVIFPSTERSFDQIISSQFPLIADQLGMAVQESAYSESLKK